MAIEVRFLAGSQVWCPSRVIVASQAKLGETTLAREAVFAPEYAVPRSQNPD